MSGYRTDLPQLRDQLFLTDGGLETTLLFHHGIDLPAFAAFDLLKSPEGTAMLVQYFDTYADLARRYGLGFLYESPTWRSNPDWATSIGYTLDEMDGLNHKAIRILHDHREQQIAQKQHIKQDPTAGESVEQNPIGLELHAHDPEGRSFVISGCVGPREDGYNPANVMTSGEAADYHSRQIGTFDKAGADLVTAVTMTNIPEAIGIVDAARRLGLPAVVSFTVETDGRLPTGATLAEAIDAVDDATESAAGVPAYYMINCAHPTHFEGIVDGGSWTERVRGIRANASKCSHAELDEAETLDDGNPAELGDDYRRLLRLLPNVNIVGGCCGTDERHIGAVASALLDVRKPGHSDALSSR